MKGQRPRATCSFCGVHRMQVQAAAHAVARWQNRGCPGKLGKAVADLERAKRIAKEHAESCTFPSGQVA